MIAEPSLDRRIVHGAAALGIPRDVYRAHVARGEKWCYRCKAWRHSTLFGARAALADGLDNECRACRNARARAAMRRLAARRKAAL